MTRTEARQLALGYAWGTGAVVASPDKRAGDVLFAEAFATAYDDYVNERRGSTVSLEHAWENWQASGGRTVDQPVILRFPGFPAIRGAGPAIVGIDAT